MEPPRGGPLARRDASHPLETACREIGLANGRSSIGRRTRQRSTSLLARTDLMLAVLEQLNLLDVERVPESWRSHLETLVAELPVDHRPTIGLGSSPTAAIELVFDIQAGLLRSITGGEMVDDGLGVASSR
ncbi:MAG TPA: hypothetical protein VGO86_01540 [Candidatus Dormibacteraeota bacterium]